MTLCYIVYKNYKCLLKKYSQPRKDCGWIYKGTSEDSDNFSSIWENDVSTILRQYNNYLTPIYNNIDPIFSQLSDDDMVKGISFVNKFYDNAYKWKSSLSELIYYESYLSSTIFIFEKLCSNKEDAYNFYTSIYKEFISQITDGKKYILQWNLILFYILTSDKYRIYEKFFSSVALNFNNNNIKEIYIPYILQKINSYEESKQVKLSLFEYIDQLRFLSNMLYGYLPSFLGVEKMNIIVKDNDFYIQ